MPCSRSDDGACVLKKCKYKKMYLNLMFLYISDHYTVYTIVSIKVTS